MAERKRASAADRAGPAGRWSVLAADPEADLAEPPHRIWCEFPGTIVLKGSDGTELPFTMQKGALLPVSPVRVVAISGGTFYGLS